LGIEGLIVDWELVHRGVGQELQHGHVGGVEIFTLVLHRSVQITAFLGNPVPVHIVLCVGE
jgi:hypothetical protein